MIQQALSAIHSTANRLWVTLHQDHTTPWEAGGAEAFGQLTGFVVAAFLGTASLGYAGKTLEDFAGGSDPQ